MAIIRPEVDITKIAPFYHGYFIKIRRSETGKGFKLELERLEYTIPLVVEMSKEDYVGNSPTLREVYNKIDKITIIENMSRMKGEIK